MKTGPVLRLYLLLALTLTLRSATVRVENLTGNIKARILAGSQVKIQASSPARGAQREDTVIVQEPDGTVLIKAQPADGVRVDLEVDIPYGFEVEARAGEGAIDVSGFSPSMLVATETGDVTISTPWPATRLMATADKAPRELVLPEGIKFSRTSAATGEWLLRDKLSEMKIVYGRVLVEAKAPGKIALVDIPVPEDSPVKLPWQAPAIVEQLLNSLKPRQASKREAAALPEQSGAEAADVGTGVARFRSEVRMVSLTAAVFDTEGHPETGLKAKDFVVLEDRVPQEVSFVGSDEVPFNLAVLLDLSGSTRRDRPAMKEAAKRFLGIARQNDKVAIYALASNLFYVVSRLTDNRERLRELIESIPEVSGGSPLYDTVVLAYAHEFRQRPSERNALIVISDGLDNQLHAIGAPSEVNYSSLLRGAEAMNVLIYPVFLDPFTKVPAPGWARRARQQMQGLASATGGRLFPAQSIQDLEPVYPLVAEELRSVYSIAYYPKNQVFDGSWRRVQVRVQRPKTVVRTRDGYFAR